MTQMNNLGNSMQVLYMTEWHMMIRIW
jgi:hypothetical protein